MKTISLAAGLLLVAILGIALLASFGDGSFAAHMIIHMGIVAVAAPLIAYGIVATPHDRLPRIGWITPVLASVLELVIVWFWHMPSLRSAADASPVLSVVEQASFLAAGLLLWTVCLRPGDGRLAGSIGLLVTSMHMTLLGVLLALAPRPLYGTGEVTCFGLPLAAVTDQQVGGVVMLLVGALAYLLGAIILMAGLLREDVRC